jgi:hypothetical protein
MTIYMKDWDRDIIYFETYLYEAPTNSDYKLLSNDYSF